MKYSARCLYAVFFVVFALCVSCASVEHKTKAAPSALPLDTGWYQYDFERTIKSIQDEYEFAQNTGMQMVQELTWKYTGVVCRFEDNLLYDPISKIELTIDDSGWIHCAENISIRGTLERDGRFVWSGVTEEHGRLSSVFVKGTLSPLPAAVRGGPEFDGIYRVNDTGTGREILAKIEDGFYTWHYLDWDEAGFTPWPTVVRPDGSFSFSMDITTVAQMGEMFSSHYSTGFISRGMVIPGRGIAIEEVSRSSGLGQDQGGAPQLFAGTVIRAAEVPNEAVPPGIESMVRVGRTAVRIQPKPNRAHYPAWYLNLPVKKGFIYATGEKTFAVQATAFAMAEAAAAANIAEYLRIHIESSITDISDAGGTRVEERIKTESLQRLHYRVVEQVYNSETGAAFVLVELEL